MERALGIAMLVAVLALIAYQAYMLRWTKTTSGSVPTVVRVIFSGIIAVLSIGAVAIVIWLVRG